MKIAIINSIITIIIIIVVTNFNFNLKLPDKHSYPLRSKHPAILKAASSFGPAWVKSEAKPLSLNRVACKPAESNIEIFLCSILYEEIELDLIESDEIR